MQKIIVIVIAIVIILVIVRNVLYKLRNPNQCDCDKCSGCPRQQKKSIDK